MFSMEPELSSSVESCLILSLTNTSSLVFVSCTTSPWWVTHYFFFSLTLLHFCLFQCSSSPPRPTYAYLSFLPHAQLEFLWWISLSVYLTGSLHLSLRTFCFWSYFGGYLELIPSLRFSLPLAVYRPTATFVIQKCPLSFYLFISIIKDTWTITGWG